MGNIQILDEFTIDKIAAGEVIERPASVVKELVENAIDSKANAITIEIKDGGISFIRVTDNGCGIEAEDVPTAFLRHATSKIRSATDLLSIHSLGFRGEALSSIAAVAQVELITKTSGALTGVRYLIAGGREASIEHIGCPEGSTFLVRNLFFNVPARQKFLKTPQTEGAHIYDLVQQLALSHPEISFQFIMNGQNRFHTSGNGNIKDIIYSVYGRDVAKSLLPIHVQNEELELTVDGFIGKPIISRGNRTFENYYINQRYIKSNVIYKAVEEAYKTFTMVHKFPFVCLNFVMNPETLDINVHPTKMELRFRNEHRLYDVLKQEVRKVLLNQDLIPEVSLEKERRRKVEFQKNAPKGAQPFETARKLQESLQQKPKKELVRNPEAIVLRENEMSGTIQHSLLAEEQSWKTEKTEKQQINEKPEKKTTWEREHSLETVVKPERVNSVSEADQLSVKPSVKPEQLTFSEAAFLEKQVRPDHRIIGQLFKTYWLIEYDHKLFIMDQHAAHEKVNYERFMKRLQDKNQRFVQQVSPPIVVTMSPREAATYEEYKEYFANFGFEIEYFGGDEYTIHGVPTDLYGIADGDAFVELLDEIVENVHGTDTTMIADKIATMACKASVKGNQRLTVEEADALIDELLTLESPFTCPHGRPTIISMTQTEIEKKFKRIQD